MTQAMYFPIALCGATDQPEAARYDRRWMVTGADGRALDGRGNDKLSAIEVRLKLGYLVMRAPGMLRLDIPLDVIEDDESVFAMAKTTQGEEIQVVDEGELAAAWMSNYLQQPARLVKIHPDEVRRDAA